MDFNNFVDCMECMACSDNVVRAGLTPKFIDVETLCKMLDYSGKPIEKTKFKGKVTTDDTGCNISKFNPPIWDFGVTEIEVGVKDKVLKLMSRIMRKPTMWFLTRSDTNQAVQLLARGLKFYI